MNVKTAKQLEEEIKELRYQLTEANDIIEAIRTGQIDALVVDGQEGHKLYTLRTADQTYRVFIEKMTEGALTLNTDGIILYANTRFAEMVGQPLSTVIGIYFEQFIAEQDKHTFGKIFKASWEEDQKEELCLKTNDGEMPIQVAITLLELEEGRSLSVFLTDLSTQKKHQKELEANNKKLSDLNLALERSNNDLQQFASVASHDLQEPLRKIQIFSNLLKSTGSEADTAEFQKYTGKIIESAGRMRALIVDVLNYSKLSASDNAYELIDLNDLLKEVLEDFEMVIKEKSAAIMVDILPYIKGIRGQIRQVFQNIISNALKFSKAGQHPFVHISCRRVQARSFDSPAAPDGPFCLITIKDNGIGFDEKYQANIFALFERLNAKENYEGTGIGMAIANKIIEKHNGLLTANSKPGEGAIFTILLPIDQN